MPRGILVPKNRTKKNLSIIATTSSPVFQLKMKLNNYHCGWTITNCSRIISRRFCTTSASSRSSLSIWRLYWTTSVGVDRTNADGMLLCQFPLCIRQVFIWDEQLKVNLCDVHSEVTPSQLKIASTSNCNSSLIFDGTSKWGENFVIILRAVVDFEPRQILAKLGRYKRSFKEKDGRHELSSAIKENCSLIPIIVLRSIVTVHPSTFIV